MVRWGHSEGGSRGLGALKGWQRGEPRCAVERAVNKRLLVVPGPPGRAAAGPRSQGAWCLVQRFLN